MTIIVKHAASAASTWIAKRPNPAQGLSALETK